MRHRQVVRTALPALVAAGFLWSLPAHTGYEGAYHQGRRAFEHGKWEKAARFFRKALEDNDESGETIRLYGVKMEPYLPYYYLGASLYEMGQHREALEQWELAIEQEAVQNSIHWKSLVKAREKILASIDVEVPDIKIADEKPPEVVDSGGKVDRIADAVEPAPARPGVVERPPYPATEPTARPPSSGVPGVERVVEGQGTPPSVPVTDLGIRESHALVVGVSEYQDRSAWSSLPGVLQDVQEVRRVLQLHGFHVTLLRDPTKNQLNEAMEDLFFTAARTEASRLLFYYAGHGATIDEDHVSRGYLVPADAPSFKKPREFRRQAISMAQFQRYAAESPARHVAFLFDSCFSGSVFKVARSGIVKGSIEAKIKETSRIFIAAGDFDQEVPDQSYFRRAFVEALEGEGDVNRDGVIFGVELGEFINERVVDRFYRSENPQNPRWARSYDHRRGDFPFQLLTKSGE